MHVLLVGHDQAVSAAIEAQLRARFISAEGAAPVHALERVRQTAFALVIAALPEDGQAGVVGEIRAARSGLPILAVVGSGNAAARDIDPANTRARVRALAAGADDVVGWPIKPAELFARIQAILRRCNGWHPQALQVGALTLDVSRQSVTAAGVPVRLTATEFALLHLLMQRRNTVVTKEAITAHLYRAGTEPEPNVIEVFLCKIRRKLAKAGLTGVISTVWWRGYTIRDPVGASPAEPQPGQPHPESTPEWSCLAVA
ncbi:MAG: response regulator [Acetobacteraceae bacterium]